MTLTNQQLRSALVECEIVVTSSLANSPEDDAACERSLYGAIIRIYNIVDEAAHCYRHSHRLTNTQSKEQTMVITTPQCVCPLCGGSISFATFSYLFHCSKCGQNYAPDKAQYLKGGKELLEAAEKHKAGNPKFLG